MLPSTILTVHISAKSTYEKTKVNTSSLSQSLRSTHLLYNPWQISATKLKLAQRNLIGCENRESTNCVVCCVFKQNLNVFTITIFTRLMNNIRCIIPNACLWGFFFKLLIFFSHELFFSYLLDEKCISCSYLTQYRNTAPCHFSKQWLNLQMYKEEQRRSLILGYRRYSYHCIIIFSCSRDQLKTYSLITI